MASTYTNDLRLELIATGEAAATWGDKTNVNLTNIASAFGYATQDGFAANADSTTTVADGAADPARAMYFKVTSSATLTATRTLTIAPNTISRVMWIENATTGGQSIQISQGTGANVTIATGKTAVVYLDGAGSGAAVVDAMAGVSSGASDTLAEILASGNATGGTDIAVGTGDDITFADSSKAIFGAGSDLQIYHDGNHSYLKDAGAGDLYIQGEANVRITDGDGNKMFLGQNDGEVQLYYNGVEKLNTTNTGIDVTGTVTADGLTVDGDATISDTTPSLLFMESDTTDVNTRFLNNGGDFFLSTINDAKSSVTNRFSLDHATGDISFYEDTGTTAKLFWDASAERLGIGTSSPSELLHVSGASSPAIRVTATNTPVSVSMQADDATGFLSTVTNHPLVFRTNNAERMRVTASGDVEVKGGNELKVYRGDNASYGSMKYLTGSGGLQFNDQNSDGISFVRGGSNETMRIDGATGNVGVGVTPSAAYKMQVAVATNTVSTGSPAAGSIFNVNGGTTTVGDGVSLQLTNVSGAKETGWRISAVTASGNNGDLVFNGYAGGADYPERMRIDSSGNLALMTDGAEFKLYYTEPRKFISNSGASVTIKQIDNDAASAFIDFAAWDNSSLMRLMNSGNVLVGTSTVAYAGTQLNIGDTSDAESGVQIQSATNGVGYVLFGDGASAAAYRGQINYVHATDHMAFNTAGGEAMRLTSAGDIYLGQTSGSISDVGTILQANGRNFFMASTTSEAVMHTYNNTSSSGAKYKISFKQNGTQVGVIEVGTSSTSYLTSSDYRLKENVVAMSGATERLKQLKPSRFNFIADADTTVDGFLAHEVQDIVPEAISGTKDAVDADGNPEYQGIDQSKLVPLLVATIQELEARIAALES